MKMNPNNMTDVSRCVSPETTEKSRPQKNKNQSPNYKSMPLKSWDLFMENYHNTLVASKKMTELAQVVTLAKKYKWQNDLNRVFAAHDYEALIITDINQNIIWVNEGFTTMTGYPQKFAINKTPRFLQGEETSLEVKNRIRQKIKQQQPFQEIIINHKKDKTPYKCEVNIIPLYGEETTHFIALERQVV